MRVCIFGSGKVATHLARRLFKKGVFITQVFSRNPEHASLLAEKVSASPISDYSMVAGGQDLYIIAVSDDAIAQVAKGISNKLGPHGAFIVHTSGATPGAILQPFTKRFGVLYPLQTFSSAVEPDWDSIPICIDANSLVDIHSLESLGNTIGKKTVVRISDEKRAMLHVAAVFANNFTNHMLHLAWRIARENDLDFDILKPLIRETIRKIEEESPAGMQTGPALRGDDKTIEAHLELLEKEPSIREVYQVLTQSIQQHKKKP
jgi:predicted short-subunit dehydrogenase-like oxidoreductase (DUF2520 family)